MCYIIYTLITTNVIPNNINPNSYLCHTFVSSIVCLKIEVPKPMAIALIGLKNLPFSNYKLEKS